MLPLLPFAAGLLVGAAAIAALRDPRARATLNRAQEGLRRAGRAGIDALTPHRAEGAAPAADSAAAPAAAEAAPAAARKPRRAKAKPATKPSTTPAAKATKAAKAPRTAKPRRAKTETPA